MKNILFIHDARFVSGLERILLAIFDSVDTTRFEMFFIGSKWSDDHFVKLIKALKMKYGITNLRFISKAYNPIVLMRYFWDLLISSVFVCNFIRCNKIDIIVANCLLDVFYAFLPSFILRKPIIWHQHAIRKKSMFTSFIVRLMRFRIKKVIAVSEAVKENLYSFGVDKKIIDVVYNGVDLNKFSYDKEKIDEFRKKYNISENDICIGMIARFAPVKGHNDFIKAADIIAKKYKNTKFLIAGSGLYSDSHNIAKNLIEELKLTDRIIFTGWIENIESFLLSLYALVHPATYEEASSVVLYEAMASGLPIIATRTGGTPEIIKEEISGYLVDRNSPQQIADRLEILLNDPSKAKAKAEADVPF